MKLIRTNISTKPNNKGVTGLIVFSKAQFDSLGGEEADVDIIVLDRKDINSSNKVFIEFIKNVKKEINKFKEVDKMLEVLKKDDMFIEALGSKDYIPKNV